MKNNKKQRWTRDNGDPTQKVKGEFQVIWWDKQILLNTKIYLQEDSWLKHSWHMEVRKGHVRRMAIALGPCLLYTSRCV